MNKKLVLNISARVVFIISFFMVFPLFWSLYYNPSHKETKVFLFLIIFGALLSYLVVRVLRIADCQIENMSPKDGLAIVGISWLVVSIFGAFPFYFSGVAKNFSDAFFESVSGFTTTGATIFTNIETLPKGILFWRSLTHWLGGMGIIVLSVALLPAFGKGAFLLFKTEVPGPGAEKLKPKVIQTAKILWSVYIILSVLETIFLMLGGMEFYDALCHTFGTMATGGFSTKNASIAYYSPYIQWVIIIFMLFAGANFMLHYQLLFGFSIKQYWKSEEFRVFSIIIILFIIVFAVSSNIFWNITLSVRELTFQIISILTTTGYTTADFDKWPNAMRFLLFLLMFIGGCAGSTGGGMKVIRIYTALKASINSILQSIFPNGIFTVKIDSIPVEKKLINAVFSYCFIFVALFVIGAVVMLFTQRCDLETAASASIACLGNIGPGLSKVGAIRNYAWITPFGKTFLAFLMLAGRLELYPILVFFTRSLWKK